MLHIDQNDKDVVTLSKLHNFTDSESIQYFPLVHVHISQLHYSLKLNYSSSV